MCKPYFESSNSQFIEIQSTVLVSKRFICLMHLCMYLRMYQNSVLGDKIEH